jgi:predicted  nucleic acid-binding Zn-ribbon protein
MSVRDELDKLSRLQELDSKMDKAKKIITSAPQAYSQIEKEVAAEIAGHQKAVATLADLEKQKRSLETEIVMDQDRIKNIESRLSNVSNNKEFHAASKEAEKAKKLISDRTLVVASLTDRITAQQAIVTEAQVRVDALQGHLETKKSEIGSNVGEADKEIATYVGDRNEIISGITPPIMTRYNRIRTRYNDAIVSVNGGCCTSCNVSLPPQMYIQVQKGLEVINCPSCLRLLYYKVQ